MWDYCTLRIISILDYKDLSYTSIHFNLAKENNLSTRGTPSMAKVAKSSLALYIGMGGQRMPMGLYSCIQFFQGGGLYKR